MKKNYLALLLAVTLFSTSIPFTSFAAEEVETQTEYDQTLASNSNADQSTASESEYYYEEATPSEATEKLDTPDGLYWDGWVANWNYIETDCEYLQEVKIVTSKKTVRLNYTNVIFNYADLEELVSTVSVIEKIAGLEQKIYFRVKAVSTDLTEYRDSNWSEWSDYIENEDEREQLETPCNLTLDETTATWDAVDKASQYYLNYEIVNWESSHNTFSDYAVDTTSDMISLFNSYARSQNLVNGEYEIRFKVKALGGDTGASAAFVASEWSEYSESVTINYGTEVTQLETPEVILSEDLTATWSEIANANEYAVEYNCGFNSGMILTKETSVNLEQVILENARYFNINPQSFNVSCRVQARVADNETSFSHSTYSNWTDSVEYEYTIETEKLGTPDGLSWDGGYAVSWNAVDNAYEYLVNYSIGEDESWILHTTETSINLESGIKEATTFKKLPAGSYGIRFRVMAAVKYDETHYTSGDYSNWSDEATYTIASDVKVPEEDKNDPVEESKDESEDNEEEKEEDKPSVKNGMDISLPASNSSSSSSSSGSSGGGGGSSDTVKKETEELPTYVETTGTWTQTNGTWTYSNNGEVYKDKWVAIQIGNSYAWFAFDANGVMRTGWFTDKDGSVYYLNPTVGSMVTGTVVIDGITYTFDNSGRLVK